MTATDEHEQTAAAPVAPETCEAIWALMAPCGLPAAGRFLRACVHEHVRDGWLCRDHAETPQNGFCRTCYLLPGNLSHECPITIAQVTS